ncbi:flavin-containing monooxygenase [Sulfitobacter donghicola]|uniref:FAD-dependent oxidoreductase n=1 Tax=Sulfitobacter donghicola DSW-25 = KCTC 12864 = JCM 14565 TaxID=1300350 RepID=A0A073IV05_9RHOB|nr:NAD(P)/FAD-dependent oxidoreductase [Sulfitobacter donghicola]KEJ89222.1 FAD-dependent oxidoreductase [Sulfitobacter donghicola DSW-25 = KCTC 12864 = JCM 14565]KIN69016.1 FAD dependent oxidoreductase [Sulfitobacter donghicola DSW-25 = KCTC 12864 = JCM 14565]
MPVETVDTLVVGAGQAGIALCEHLGKQGAPFLVLEKSRIAESWRTSRWDALVTNGPVWHDRFPNLEFKGNAPDEFVGKDRVADYIEEYAGMVDAPVRTGVEVIKAERLPDRAGFRVETTQGVIEAARIVSATGAFQHPVMPPIVPEGAQVSQMHSASYRNPEQLAEGAVMVVGAGSSGAQIADELNRAGRKVYLSVGPHDRPPRRYRGRDFVWWLGVLGLWDMAAQKPGAEHVTISVSGAYGGRTMDFRRLAGEGVTLLGLTDGYDEGTVSFADDLGKNIAAGDANYFEMLDAADAYAEAMGLDLPLEPEAREMFADPECLTNPISSLDLAKEGITTIIWATGFKQDFSWLKVDAFDDQGAPIHQRGVSKEPGVYFLGLPWQSRRGSTFLWGVWHDAKFIADQIAIQRAYADYQGEAAIVLPAAE